MSAYEGLAQYYDGLTADVDYARWEEWYMHWFAESRIPVRTVLDLACGTGTLTCRLAAHGYSMIGADCSEEMLTEAAEKAAELPCEAPFFLHQSMDELELYSPVDACVSSLDSINYMTEEIPLREALRRVHTWLLPGGLFLFDILAPARLAERDGQIFVDETEDVLCLWRADFDREGQVLTYGIDLFERSGEIWRREQEEHRERAWSAEQLVAMLREAGFSEVQIFGDFTLDAPCGASERLCFVCVNGETIGDNALNAAF